MYSKKFFIIALSPAILVFLAMMVYPFCQVIFLSLTNYKLTGIAEIRFIGFNQYIKLFSDLRFYSSILRTIYFSILSVLFSVFFGFVVAYLLQAKYVRGTGFFRTIILIPMFMTPLVAGAVFRYLFDYDFGMINYIILQLGLKKIQFLSSPSWALISAVIVDVWQWVPFAATVFCAALESIPKEHLEAAEIDGAGWWRRLFYMKFPFLRSAFNIVILIRFMDAFREFDKIYILTSGGPGTSSETVSIYAWRQAFQYYNTGYSAATGIMMLLIINIISVLYFKLTKLGRGLYDNV
ncbi:MAG TPA: sugar ABC transporter permease [Christensenellaceae bacterium]|nr:sugar ABC transporter permease [Christensenellaceae bacterium]